MAEAPIRVGQRVIAKELPGVVAYVGTTLFAAGKWFGVILDEPKGKNNGSVQGKSYFQCEDNHGVFVRQGQLAILGEVVEKSTSLLSKSEVSTPVSKIPKTGVSIEKPKSRLPMFGSGGRGSATASPKESTKSSPHVKQIPTRKSTSTQDISSKKASKAGSAQDLSESKRLSAETNLVKTGSSLSVSSSTDSTPAGPVVHSSKAAPAIGVDQSKELDNMRSEIKDLNEKLETLKAKRSQDREKLKETEKMKIKMDQLQEFKTQMLEQQSQLQKQLLQVRQEKQEAVDSRDRVIEETSDVQETLEMAALDKEMAEEKAEVLQGELEQANERIEELRVDLQILQEEVQQKGDAGEATATTFQVKQLTQHNERLKDALIKIRDAAAQDKNELQRVLKELDTSKSKLVELERERDKYSSMVKRMEDEMTGLQENVDAALGSERMVEQLTDRNLSQEETLKELEEHVKTLESLVDAGEEIAENNRELELELRQELDSASTQLLQMERQRDAAYEMVADHGKTIAKFRELVQRQQDDNELLREQLQRETNQPLDTPAEKIDFKKMFAETKAYAKTIEMDLRKIEVLLANRHVELVSKFLPEYFMTRGGDHDAILMLLLVSRLSMKVETLISPIREKFPAPETIDVSSVLKYHSVDQYSFGNRLTHLLVSLQSALDQYDHALSAVDVDCLLRVSEHYPDMAAQEKILDFYIDLLRDDQLGENVGLEKLERAVHYFTALFPTLLSDAPLHHFRYLSSTIKTLYAACTSISTEAQRLKVMSAEGESSELFEWTSSTADECNQLTRKIRRHLPQHDSVKRLSYSQEVYEELVEVQRHLFRVSSVMRETGLGSAPLLSQLPDREAGIPSEKLMDLVARGVDLHYGTDDNGPQSVRTSLTDVSRLLQKFCKSMEKGEFDSDGRSEEQMTAPIELRMLAVRTELQEGSGLKKRLQDKEEEIKEIKLSMKMKQEELSEMNVRREMAEKKLSGSTKDADLTIEKLQRKLDDANALLKRKQREFEDTMNQLQTDLDSMESERGELKEKLKQINKKALIEGLSKSALGGGGGGGVETVSAAVTDSPGLLREVHDLQQVVRRQWTDICQLRSQQTTRRMDRMIALHVPQLPLKMDDEYKDLENRCTKLQHEISELNIPLPMPDWRCSNYRQRYIAARSRRQSRAAELSVQYQRLRDDVLHYLSRRSTGGRALSQFGCFPSKSLLQSLSVCDDAAAVARLSVAGTQITQVSSKVDVSLTELQAVHQSVLALVAPV